MKFLSKTTGTIRKITCTTRLTLFRVLRTFLFAFISFTVMSSLHGQEIQKITPHVPTSPQAEAFQKYGQYSINYSTGVPDISIPLYEINHRGYKIPISLSYNPQPLRPGYNYDVFGFGWGLSINSCVSRSIESLPDEWRDFKLEQNKFGDFYHVCPSCVEGCQVDPRCNPELQPSINLSAYNLAHDKFNVTLPNGKSFDFIIDQGPVFTVSNGMQVKILCNYTQGNINSFIITDDDGVKYTFDGSDTPYNGPYTSFSSSYVSWQLTRIDLPYSTEPITFQYNYTIQSPYDLACIEPGINIADYSEYLPDQYGTVLPAHTATCKDAPSSSPSCYKMKLLSSINYGNTSIILIYQNQSTTAAYNYVTNLRVFENSAIIRDIQLAMDIKSMVGYCSSNPLAKLDSVKIKGSDLSASPQVYKCSYKSSDYQFYGTDHWGYLNDYSINYDVANFNLFVEFDLNYFSSFLNSGRVSAVTKSPQDLCPYSKIKLSRLTYDNRRPSTPERHGVLSSLTYPTGGHTDFEFENHQFLTSTDYAGNFILDPQNRVPAIAAGFRIKKITNYSKDGVVAGIQTFKYGKTYGELYGPNYVNANLHTGLGEAVVDPNILTYMNHSYYIVGYPSNFVRNMILGLNINGENTSFLNPFITDEYTFQSFQHLWKWECSFSASNFRRIVNGRTPVLYPEVTVYEGDIETNMTYSPEKTTGKTVYRYDLTEQGVDLLGKQGDIFFESPQYYGNTIDYIPQKYRYNKLNEKLDYKFDGSGFTLLKKESYTWSNSANSSLEYISSNKYPTGFIPAFAMVGDFFITKADNFGNSQMSSKSTTWYDNGNQIYANEDYRYNERYQLVYKSMVNSKNKIVENSYYYPQTDVNGNTPDIISKMLTKNIISPVLESKTKVSENYLPQPTEIEGAKVDYKEFTVGASTIIMPAQTYDLEIKPSGSEYVLQNEVTKYSGNGNPLEFVSKDGIRSGYLWGYNDRYLVIKADNIDNATLTNLVNASLPSGYSTLEALLNSITSLPNTNWTSFNRNLRNNVPAKTMVTTYTYKPLIGLTSQTDPNGQSTFYEYDSFGRLMNIRDNNQNILKHYDYHYKQ